ncbi:hypothetical protein NHQ30_002543 [Ciborinia camelliae]|nr:hypothetical protein NHQ30_002543 [Ciborinia camelliae]
MCFFQATNASISVYFIPLAIFLKAPAPLTVSYYIWKSMIPSLLGNIIGGGLFCGGVYWYLYLAHETVPIHFDTTDANTAVYEQGGPIQRQATVDGAGTGYGHAHDTSVVPNSGNNGKSGIAKDLHLGVVESLARKKEGSEGSSESV